MDLIARTDINLAENDVFFLSYSLVRSLLTEQRIELL
jgi:hypothetical protein